MPEPEITEHDPTQTLKIGFPPAGSPTLDLEVCPADLTVGIIQTLGKLVHAVSGVALHPDVAKALGAIVNRLEHGPRPPLNGAEAPTGPHRHPIR